MEAIGYPRIPMLKIDVFPHILPRPFFDRLLEVAPSSGLMVKRVQNIPVMIDLEKRFEIMDRHEGYRQVLTLSAPPLENVAGPELSPDLAKLANDEMAKLVERYPDRFPGFVASLPMNNPDAAMGEIDRAINQLGATGVQVFTNVNGEPLDKPEYLQLFERMAAIDLPVWMHPARTANFPDYVGEQRSKFDMWWAFGWPYETAVAMGRLLFSGLLDRHPNLKIITHHLGGMVPHFEGRVGGGLDLATERPRPLEDRQDGIGDVRPGQPVIVDPAENRLETRVAGQEGAATRAEVGVRPVPATRPAPGTEARRCAAPAMDRGRRAPRRARSAPHPAAAALRRAEGGQRLRDRVR